jgi:hypothetical protein
MFIIDREGKRYSSSTWYGCTSLNGEETHCWNTIEEWKNYIAKYIDNHPTRGECMILHSLLHDHNMKIPPIWIYTLNEGMIEYKDYKGL